MLIAKAWIYHFNLVVFRPDSKRKHVIPFEMHVYYNIKEGFDHKVVEFSKGVIPKRMAADIIKKQGSIDHLTVEDIELSWPDFLTLCAEHYMNPLIIKSYEVKDDA